MILLNGIEFNMKGVAWFGFETDTYIVHGLASWANGGHDYTYYLQFLQDNGFNAIRLPFSQDLVDFNPTISSTQINGGETSLNTNTFSGKTALEAMDIIIEAAGEYGILIMLDFHSKSNNAYTQGFYDLNPTTAQAAWQVMANRYKDYWNVFMLDVYNEPHDVSNGQFWEWIDYCETIGNDLIDNYGVNWLVAVQGTNAVNLAGHWTNWGGNLEPAASDPVTLNTAKRVVYSPHVVCCVIMSDFLCSYFMIM